MARGTSRPVWLRSAPLSFWDRAPRRAQRLPHPTGGLQTSGRRWLKLSKRRQEMEFFLDSANLEEIERWLKCGVIDGVTTNPSILLKDGGYDMEARAKGIADLVHPRPVSVEVTTNDLEEMTEQARILAGWAPNIVVKIPVINEYGEPCLGVVNTLEG